MAHPVFAPPNVKPSSVVRADADVHLEHVRRMIASSRQLMIRSRLRFAAGRIERSERRLSDSLTRLLESDSRLRVPSHSTID
jgi:hypothetical protein